MALWFLALLGPLSCVGASAPAGPWDKFNYAPKSRTVFPTTIKEVSGTIHNPQHLVTKGSATLSGNGSWVALDFGIEVSICVPAFRATPLIVIGRRTDLFEL